MLALFLPADDEDGVRFGGERLDLRLAFLRRIADRVEDDRVREPLPDAPADGRVLLHVLGRLGDDADLPKLGKPRHLFRRSQDNARIARKAEQPVHLRMFPVPGDQDRVPRGRMLPDDGLDAPHPGTGGVDDPEPLLLDLFPLGGGYPVGADDHGGAGGRADDFIETPDRNDAPFP